MDDMAARIVSEWFNVRPRYTPGSPAMVNSEVAMRVAMEERSSYESAIKGSYGEDKQTKALAVGMRGIVERWTEYATRWRIVDMITGDETERPFKPHKEGKRVFAFGGNVRFFTRDRCLAGKPPQRGKVFGKQKDKLIIQWDDDQFEELDPADTNLEPEW